MAMALGVGLVYDERMCAHQDEDYMQSEQPARITSIYDRLKSAGIVERCIQVDARKATTAELQTVHSADYVALIQGISSKSRGRQRSVQKRYDSIYFGPGSSESALLAAGSVIEVATQVAEGKLAAGACVVRPPGHHAEADEARGFCLFNNVAVAAHILAHTKKDLGVQKVLIVDWDVHHGNATQHMFWNDPQVLYFSVHRYDKGRFYPEGGEGNFDKVGIDKGEGYNINVPWPHGGFGDADYLAVWEHILMPVALDFNPDIVFISAGCDPASGDPLGACEVTPDGFFNMTQQLMGLAKGRVVLALEGGYNLVSISNSYLACMQALLGDSIPKTPYEWDLLPESLDLIEQVRNELEKYWPVLGKELKVMQPDPPPSLSAEGYIQPPQKGSSKHQSRHLNYGGCLIAKQTETPINDISRNTDNQFDVDDGLLVRDIIKKKALKQIQLPLSFEKEQGSCSQALNNPFEGPQENITPFQEESGPPLKRLKHLKHLKYP